MRFNRHSQLEGKHAFLSASKASWLNYTPEKLERVYLSNMAAKRGTDLHALAAEMIRLGVKLPDTTATLNQYVNDAIGFRMSPEITLFYSVNAFGTVDTISFRDRLLRIHDLKTGTLHTSERQLEVYAAYFCLEYGINPIKDPIDIELRIYQNDEFRVFEADPTIIDQIMRKTVAFDRQIDQLREDTA